MTQMLNTAKYLRMKHAQTSLRWPSEKFGTHSMILAIAVHVFTVYHRVCRLIRTLAILILIQRQRSKSTSTMMNCSSKRKHNRQSSRSLLSRTQRKQSTNIPQQQQQDNQRLMGARQRLLRHHFMLTPRGDKSLHCRRYHF